MKSSQPISNRSEPARGSTLAQVKTAQLARDEEERTRIKRVKGLLVLMEQFLLDQGYVQSLAHLQQESGVSLQTLSPADNIDLMTVVTEYEQYYAFKWQRKPKLYRTRNGADDDDGRSTVTAASSGEKMLVRKQHHTSNGTAATSPSTTQQLTQQGNHAYATESGDVGASPAAPKHLRPVGNPARALAAVNESSSGAPPIVSSSSQQQHQQQQQQLQLQVPPHIAARRRKKLAAEQGNNGAGGSGEGLDGLNLAGQKMNVNTHRGVDDEHGSEASEEDAPCAFYNGRALRPLPVFPTADLNDLAATIMRDILDVNPAVRWTDIAELDSAKHLLKEAVVMPVKYPELFHGILRPWKGILLFGPPGTGKTLLAKAVATECKTTFFNISASSVVSKWRGDSEKLVRMLFDLAVHYAPSTIFIDEVDSLMSARSSEGEHEGSRRMKTELLSQMDGLAKRRGGDVVFVLAASNTPWDLDTAMLRRLEKRVLVSLPTPHAREVMFHRLLRNHVLGTTRDGGGGGGGAVAADMDWAACARLTEGMSGADIDVVCREAMMRPIRTMIAKLEGTKRAGGDNSLATEKLEKPRVSLADVEASVACTRSSVGQEDLRRYDEWMAKFGSGMSS